MNEISGQLEKLKNCNFCPRECGANRFGKNMGYCRGTSAFNIASVYKHKGEEPVISGSNGICNVFFAGCNMDCIFCQNHQISSKSNKHGRFGIKVEDLITDIHDKLDEGCHAVGFVSPSHYIYQMMVLIDLLKSSGRSPVFVMNTNAYDKVEVLSELDSYIDVYLPDFKYMDDSLALSFSDAPGYSEIAVNAIREMVRQKGDKLIINERGEAESGVIIRHLVLPGYIENSKAVLRCIAREISTKVHISLMSQYNPVGRLTEYQGLMSKLSFAEYDQIMEEMYSLGFENGWVQELDSAGNYNPDFTRDDPFCS